MTHPQAAGPTGTYHILERIGSGGMAEVLLAHQQGLAGFDRLVVVKRILPHLADQPEFVRMFLDEARLMARLTHPNIAQVYDVGQLDGRYFIAMEYIRGVTLADLLDRALERSFTLPYEAGARVLAEICAALQYAYGCPGSDGRPLHVVHRDLSPQNVMISFDGAVKLMDFGIAKAADRADKTQTGVVKGKYAYMSPEQIQGLPLDQRSDIFSAGLLLFETTTGQRPYAAIGEYEITRSIVSGKLHSPRASLADYPAALDKVYRKATALRPEKRYPDARSMQDALEAYLTQVSAPSATLTLPRILNRLFPEGSDERRRIFGREQRQPSEVLSAQRLDLTRGGESAAAFSVAGTGIALSRPPLGRIAALALTGAVAIAAAAAGIYVVVGGARAPAEAVVVDAGGADVAGAPGPDAAGATSPGAAAVEPSRDTRAVESGGAAADGGSDVAPPEAVAAAAPPGSSGATGSTGAAGSSASTGERRPTSRRSAPRAPRAAPSAKAAVAGVGHVTITSTPWGEIHIDGKPYGETPLARVPLTSGMHTIRVRNPETAKTQQKRVQVKADQLTVVRFELAP